MEEKIIATGVSAILIPCHRAAMDMINSMLADNHCGIRIDQEVVNGGSKFTLVQVYDPFALRFGPETMTASYLRRKSDGMYVAGGDGDDDFVETIADGATYFQSSTDELGRPDDEITAKFLIDWNVNECGMDFLQGANPDDFEVVITPDPDEVSDEVMAAFFKNVLGIK